jgi:hypothetical protein
VYVERLVLRNFRCFEEAEVRFNYPGRPTSSRRPAPDHRQNVNLFLGGNGSGKSSVFQALALGVLAPVIRSSGFKAEFLVRRLPGETDPPTSPGAPRGNENAEARSYLKLHELDASPLPSPESSIIGQSVIRRIGDVEDVTTAYDNPPAWQRMLYQHNSAAFFIVGYGASRRTERPEGYSESSRTPRYQRVASLFEEHVGLVPFTYAYLQLNERGYLDEARSLLNDQLLGEVTLTGWRMNVSQRPRPLFSRDEVLLPFNALSDGFRAFVGWFWDLLYQIARLDTPNGHRLRLTECPGVVIVDEIDLFLHPDWQRLVISRVADAFPRLQFFFSSHSPLVAATLERENVFVLENNRIEQYRERIYGLPPNQVLTSSYFGLRSTRAPGTGTLADLARHELRRDDAGATIEQAEPTDRVLERSE